MVCERCKHMIAVSRMSDMRNMVAFWEIPFLSLFSFRLLYVNLLFAKVHDYVNCARHY